MAQTSGFFDSEYNQSTQSYDLEYFSAQFAAYFALFVKSGVFGSPTNQLRVSNGSGLSVEVAPGWAFINGYWYYNSEELILPVVPNVSSSTRTDSVICRWSSSDRRISVIIQTGSTEVTRTDSVYDLLLAEIVVPAGAVSISMSNITDKRTDENVCGLVTHLLKVQTTSDLFAQYESIFNEWFNTVKGQISGDLAIKLQLEFTQLEQTVQNYQDTVDEQVSEISRVAEDAKNTIQTFVDNDFTIPKQSLSFTSGVCTVIDDRVTENSLVDVYFTAESMPIAEASQIYVDSAEGKIILTASTQPTSSLDAMIRVRVM